MTADPVLTNLEGDPAQEDVRVRCLTVIDEFHTRLDRAFDELLSIPQSRRTGDDRQSIVLRRTAPLARMGQ
jgi:hypothetical protein